MTQIRNFDMLLEQAKEKPAIGLAVVLPHDTATMYAVKDGVESGFIMPHLFGDEAVIRKLLTKVGLEENLVSITNCEKETAAVTEAIRSVKEGVTRVLMKGGISTTALMKSVMDKASGLNNGGLLSHVTVCEVPDFGRLLMSTDGGINIAPTLDEKIIMIQNALVIARALNIDSPRVAILSAVEMVSSKIPSTIDAACLAKMADRGAFGNAYVDGPLSIDNILSAEAAKTKAIHSQVAGRADIVLSPNIETANTFSKTLHYMAKSINAGIVVGAAAPIILPSRASDNKSKWASLALGILITHA